MENYDWHASLVQAARGCPKSCPYCNIPGIYGNGVRLRPVDDVIKDISALSGKEFYLTEDVIMFPSGEYMDYTTGLFKRMAGLDVRVFITSSLAFNVRPDFLRTLAEGGCRSIYITFGFDPISGGIYKGNPKAMAKGKEIVDNIQSLGMRFYAAFGIGFDGNDESTADHILEFCRYSGIVTAEFFIATPFPNTPFWTKLNQENRILHTDWSKYNCANVVFTPARMTPGKLVESFLRLWKEFYSGVSYAESIDCFSQNEENLAMAREYSKSLM
jgi:radical SAM superfamily enzyme YgiQ (UPF0313 family)